MNMGKSEGAQIIQLFGRGVRLKGKGYSLKREDSGAPYWLKALQTISIVGLNASYINRFLVEIENEVPDYTEFPIELVFNNPADWDQQIMTFKTEEGWSFKEKIIELKYIPEVAARVNIDMRNRVSMAVSGFNSSVADDSSGYRVNFLQPYLDFINYQSLTIEANRYKLIKGYNNLMISKTAIEEVIRSSAYYVYSHPGQFGLPEAINGKVQDIVGFIIKDYINKFYSDKEKSFLTQHLTYDMLDRTSRLDMFPASQRMIVKVPKQYASVVDELTADIQQLHLKDSRIIPSLHFSNHLYSPIASWEKGEKYNEIKTVPVRLNQG
jgi:hypothetical protein